MANTDMTVLRKGQRAPPVDGTPGGGSHGITYQDQACTALTTGFMVGELGEELDRRLQGAAGGRLVGRRVVCAVSHRLRSWIRWDEVVGVATSDE